MLTSKRKHKRFDIPLTIKFRPVNGAAEYCAAVTKNFSCEGVGLETDGFEFTKHETLELNFKLPASEKMVSLLGGVVWETQIGDKNLAGIKLKMKNKQMRNEMEKIFSRSKIPINSIYSNDPDYMIKGEKKKKPAPKPAAQKKMALEPPGNSVPVRVGKKKAVSGPARQKKKPQEQPENPGFVKQYNKSGSKCKVTFRLPGEAVPDMRKVAIVGDFNKWDISGTPMTRLENGDFLVTLNLKSKREYRFKYLIDGNLWENDWRADRYVPNAFGSDDSVVIV